MKCQKVICPLCNHEFISMFDDSPFYKIKKECKEFEGYPDICPKCSGHIIVVWGEKQGKTENDFSTDELICTYNFR
ncbi:MAG: hypothetical protein IKH13_03645 [Clostridia bacterium]|nr:hypothetical protein [Clostridia bacterium]